MRWIVLSALLAAPAGADTCPAAPDISDRLQALIAQAQAAQTEYASSDAAAQMWALWRTAPDAHAQELLDTGMERLRIYDFAGAEAALSALVDYCPDYAEGYNQRAFVNFLRQDYAVALVDLDRALELSPSHVAALAGKALTLFGLGRDDEGQAALRAALALNPWLPERALLREAPGKDI